MRQGPQKSVFGLLGQAMVFKPKIGMGNDLAKEFSALLTFSLIYVVELRFVRNSHHFMCLRFVQNKNVLYFILPTFRKKTRRF